MRYSHQNRNIRKVFSMIRLLTLMGCITIATHSCVKDDTDGCYETTKVRVVVRTISETRAAGSGEIENLTIYIFDENKFFAGTWQGDAYVYGEEYVAELELDPGIYHFVVWSNQGTYYAGTGGNSAAELVVEMHYPEDKKVNTDIPDLHHGMLLDAEVIPRQSNEFEIIVRPDTYRLNFTVGGLLPDEDYLFRVTDNNTHYAFDNTIIEGMDDIEYIRTARYEGGELTASMNVLRLTDDRDPPFDISNNTTAQGIFADGLVSIIKNAYAKGGRRVDFDREFEYDIKLVFNGSLGVTISVNGWSYNSNDTQLTGR